MRAATRGEDGKLHIGYAPAPTVEILPSALSTFRKAMPRVRILLHDLSSDEIVKGLRNGELELAIMLEPIGERAAGIHFEPLHRYPICVALAPSHPFARLKSVHAEKLRLNGLLVGARKATRSFLTILNLNTPLLAQNRASLSSVTPQVR
jgi:DNA-binding transcriptional LysR family regulator